MIVFESRPCDGDCFHCRYPDCVRSPAEILAMDAGKHPRMRRNPYHHKKPRARNVEWTPERIKALRGSLTKKEFAQLIGCARTTVCEWELGYQYPSAKLAERLKELEQEG